MKTTYFIRYLNQNNCLLTREGGIHSIFQHTLNKKISSVPRHREVKNNLVRKICKDLEIALPKNLQ